MYVGYVGYFKGGGGVLRVSWKKFILEIALGYPHLRQKCSASSLLKKVAVLSLR